MKLLKVDKQDYRKKINTVIIAFVSSLAVMAVGFGAILIHLFGSEVTVSGEPTGNFHLNLIGVIIAVAVNSFSLNKLVNLKLDIFSLISLRTFLYFLTPLSKCIILPFGNFFDQSF